MKTIKHFFYLILFFSFTYSQSSDMIEPYSEIIAGSYQTDLISYRENNLDYHMLFLINVYENGHAINLKKYNSTGEIIKETTLKRGKEECYSSDVRNINGRNSYLISCRELIYLNETYIKVIDSNKKSYQGYCSTYFTDLYFIFLRSFSVFEKYYPKIYIYDKDFNFKIEKYLIPYEDRSKYATRGSKIIATNSLYEILFFYSDQVSNNLIINTLSYNNETNEIEELNSKNYSDYKKVSYIHVDYIDINNKNLIIFCLNNQSVYCLYGNYNKEKKELIYDKNYQFELPYKCSSSSNKHNMRIIKNKDSFYYICVGLQNYPRPQPYYSDIHISIIKYKEGKPLYSEEGKRNIQFRMNVMMIAHLNFVNFEKKGPAIFHFYQTNNTAPSIMNTRVTYLLPPISCKNSTIKLITNSQNDFNFSSLFEVHRDSQSLNKNITIIKIPEEIDLYYMDELMKNDNGYYYDNNIVISTSNKIGMFSILFYPACSHFFICELNVNVYNNSLLNISSNILEYKEDNIEIKIKFENNINHINFNKIELININNSESYDPISFSKINENELKIIFKFLKNGFYYFKFNSDDNIIDEKKENLIIIKGECEKGFITIKNKCIHIKDLIYWNLTDFCKSYCNNENYKYCIKGFGKDNDESKCICKKGYKGKKCEIEYSNHEEEKNNIMVVEEIKIKNFENNEKFSFNQYVYIDNEFINSYQYNTYNHNDDNIKIKVEAFLPIEEYKYYLF